MIEQLSCVECLAANPNKKHKYIGKVMDGYALEKVCFGINPAEL